ncbi:MAG: aspartyl/asparaginyl beta-hydroxylase domain-containing protein [Allosphingosinicella sp.]
MQIDNAEAERLVRAGAEALQRGDARGARGFFEKVTATGRSNAQIWLLLAHSCRLTGDSAAEEKALDSLLAMEPRSLRGLIMKGDCRGRAGDARGATRFYKAARTVAAGAGQLPPDLVAEMQRIEGELARADAAYRAHLEARLAEKGVGPEARSAAFQESLEILSGEKQIYVQQPSLYYFPRLPHIQFYEREAFAWAEALEAATDDIRREILAVAAEEGAFRPYLVSDPDTPRTDFHGLSDNPDWSSLYLWENGAPVEANRPRFGATFAALEQVPLPRIGVRAPVVMFSRLRPGARIPPHSGSMNARLICHLPLVVPPGCGFRVGNEVREWEEGKLLVFDDTIEHEAWNEGTSDRIVLIFDIWRPELEEAERRAVAAVFEAVDEYGAGAGGGTAGGA